MKKKTKKPAEVTIRYANPSGGRMAARKKKGGGSRRKSGRRNPSNPKRGHRRRRNPGNTFGDRFGKLAGLALVTLASGAAVLVAQSRIQPGTALSEYGIPVVGFVAGVALAKKMPTLGTGIAAGSAAAPFVLPLGSKIAGMLPAATPAATTTTTPTTTATTSGLQAAIRQRLGGSRRYMGAVNLGAVNLHYA